MLEQVIAMQPAADQGAGRRLGRTLVLGYGNTDRQDDGVAWHVLHDLSGRLGAPILTAAEDLRDAAAPVGLLFQLQLTPELVEYFVDFEQVIFVDAQTGATGLETDPAGAPADVQIKEVTGRFQSSPLTHHLTPEACMALLRALYAGEAVGILISIKGYEFGFSQQMSAPTTQAARLAAAEVMKLVSDHRPNRK